MRVPSYHFLLLFAFGCSPSPASINSVPIDFDRLIDEQVNALSQQKNTLEKEAEVDGYHSDSTLVPTAEIWMAELALFRQLGLVNKSLHKGSYREEGPLDDTRSNLKIQQYVSDSSPLGLLMVYYHGTIDRVRRIEGTIKETNQLYTSVRNLTLEFDEDGGKQLLVLYGINGYQKVALRDTVRFSVQARISW